MNQRDNTRQRRRTENNEHAKVEEGKYYLEDHTGQVPLDLSRASLLTDGFVTENSIVLVQGEAVDGVLHVHHMGECSSTDAHVCWCMLYFFSADATHRAP